MIAQQMAAEGVERIAAGHRRPRALRRIVRSLPALVTLHDRKDMDAVQRELREYRRRVGADLRPDLRGREAPPPQERRVPASQRSGVFINEAVCEGCGDCGVQSNCTSILPMETEFGRKRAIDQSSCNQDYSCVKGFCPSFVTVEGGTLRKATRRQDARLSSLRPAAGTGYCRTRRSALQHPDHRHRRHRRHHHRRAAGHGRAPGRQGHLGAGHDRHVAEKRRRHFARSHRRARRPASAPNASPPAKPT